MNIKVNKKKWNVVEITNFFDKFKGIKFILNPIQDVYRFQSHYANTYFLFQRVDIVMTDAKNKILYLYPNCKTEKFIFPKRKVRYVHFFPVNSCQSLEIGQSLNVIEDKKG